MRYPRNAKIFRGQLEFAPLAGVLFLLLIFLLLGSLMSPPGIPIQLASDSNVISGEKKLLLVTQKGEIVFENQTNTVDNLDALRLAIRNLPAGQRVVLTNEPGAPKEIRERVRQSLENIELPTYQDFSGTDNAVLVVGVSLGGQLFFENELVDEEQLKQRLRDAIGNSKEAFTVAVLADKTMPDGTLVRLSQIAQEVGIKQLLLVTEPPATHHSSKL